MKITLKTLCPVKRQSACPLTTTLFFKLGLQYTYYHVLINNRPYSRGLFPTYPESLRCQIQAGQSKLVSLTHFLPCDIFPCAVCVQTKTGHLTENLTI